MAKKGLKRKQKSEVIKEEEPKVILPLVRRSDEPVPKKVLYFDHLIPIESIGVCKISFIGKIKYIVVVIY